MSLRDQKRADQLSFNLSKILEKKTKNDVSITLTWQDQKEDRQEFVK